MKAFLKKIVAIIIVVTAFGAGARSEGADPPEAEDTLPPLEKKASLAPGTYTVKANLVLENEKHNFVAESLGLDWPKKNPSDFNPTRQGWVARNDSTYFWNPGEDKSLIDIPLTFDQGSPRITDFNELHIDYQDLFPKNPAHVSLDISLTGVKSDDRLNAASDAKGEKKLLKVGEKKLLKVDRKKLLKTIDALGISPTPWIIKNYLYVVKRLAGLPFDALWHYNQQGNDTFFQRRLHRDLDPVEALDLVFQPDAMPLKIHVQKRIIETGNRLFACNLRIGFGSRLKKTEIIPCSSLPLRVIKDQDKQVLQVEVGALVRDYHKQGKERVFLEEIIVHLPRRKAWEVAAHPLLEKIVFQEWDKLQKEEWLKSRAQKETIPEIILFSRIEELSGEKKRLVLNLQGLVDQIGKNTRVGNIALSIEPDDSERRSGVHLQRAEMVKLMGEERPLFLGMGERLSRRWGGPFLAHKNEDKKAEWVKVDSYLSLLGRGKEKSNNLISIDEGEIKTEDSFSSSRSTKGGLEIEGQGKWVEIDWSVHTRVGLEERFYFQIPEGAESILGMRVEPRYGGRSFPAVATFPNLPVEINAVEIDGIKIRLELDGKPFHLVLKEMALFQPVALTPAEALDILQPTDASLASTSIHGSGDVDLRSVHDDLIQYPIMRWNGREFFHPDNIPAVDLFANNHWANLGSFSIEHNSKIDPSYPSHPYLHVRRIIFEKSETPGILSRINTEFERNMGANVPSGLSQWTKLLFAAFFILVIQWLWKHEWWSKPEANEILAGWLSKAQTVLLSLYRQVLPLTTVINRLLGLAIAGLGLWAMQVFDNLGFRNPVLWVVVSFLLCVLWHELRGRSRESSPVVAFVCGRNGEIPYALHLTALFVIVWIIWQSGHRGVGQDISEVWLSLALLGYLYLPWLEPLLAWLWERHHRLWFAMTGGLYAVGLLMTVTRSENYYFTFGSIALALAWHSFMMFIRPRFEAEWPVLADKIYGGRGTLYVFGFALVFVGAVLAFLVNLDKVAEQFGVIGYYMLLIGLILEAGVFKKQNPEVTGI